MEDQVAVGASDRGAFVIDSFRIIAEVDDGV
jgi:hypothetical protein